MSNNQSTSQILKAHRPVRNRALIETVSISCELVDHQGSGQIIWLYILNNNSVNDFVYVNLNVLKTVLNSSSENPIIVTCAIYMIKLILTEWCRIYLFGSTDITINVKEFPYHVYLDPSKFNRGSSVMCQTNSTDSLFVFQWSCLILDAHYILKINNIDFPLAPNEAVNILSNLILYDSQSVTIDYLMPAGYYECDCTAISLVVEGNHLVNASETFQFAIKDYVAGKVFSEQALFAYTILSMIGWFILVLFIFCRMSLYQLYKYKSTVYAKQLRSIHNITTHKIFTADHMYRTYFVDKTHAPLDRMLTNINVNYTKAKFIVEKRVYKICRRRTSSVLTDSNPSTDVSQISEMEGPIHTTRKKPKTTDQSRLYREKYKRKDRKSAFIRRRVESFLRKISSTGSNDELDVESIFESKFPKRLPVEDLFHSHLSKNYLQSQLSRPEYSSVLNDESLTDNSLDTFHRHPHREQRRSRGRSAFEMNKLRFRNTSVTSETSRRESVNQRPRTSIKSQRESINQRPRTSIKSQKGTDDVIRKEAINQRPRTSIRSQKTTDTNITKGSVDNQFNVQRRRKNLKP